MKKNIYNLLAIGILSTLSGTSLSAQSLLDDWETIISQHSFENNASTTPTDYHFSYNGGGVLGGQRDITVKNFYWRWGPGSLGDDFYVGASLFNVNTSGDPSYTAAILTYDGNDDNNAATLDATVGLGGIDMTGNGFFKTKITAFDVTSGASIVFRVYSAPDHYSDGVYSGFPGVVYPGNVTVALSRTTDFTLGAGAVSPADFSAVTAVQFMVNIPPTSSGVDWMLTEGIEIPTLYLAGNVFHDADGLENALVNGASVNISETGALFANLIDPATNTIVASVPINTDGSYKFDYIKASTTYKVQLSKNQGIKGNAAPVVALPADWINVGEQLGTSPSLGLDAITDGSITVAVGTGSVNEVNFGIQKIPLANNVSQTVSAPVGSALAAGSVSAPVVGSDPEDGALGNPNKIIITALPTNSTLHYNGSPVTVGQTITGFNPALLSYTAISNGATSTTFKYDFFDAANVQGAAPADYTVSWGTPVPVVLSEFDGIANACNAVLTWETATEINFSHFELEYSTDGIKFGTIANVEGGQSTYRFVHAQAAGAGYYRLKMIDRDGAHSYSQRTVKIVTDCDVEGILVYPNPTHSNINVKGASVGSTIMVVNAIGQTVMTTTVKASSPEVLTVSHLAAGTYMIVVQDGSNHQTFKVVKQD